MSNITKDDIRVGQKIYVWIGGLGIKIIARITSLEEVKQLHPCKKGTIETEAWIVPLYNEKPVPGSGLIRVEIWQIELLKGGE